MRVNDIIKDYMRKMWLVSNTKCRIEQLYKKLFTQVSVQKLKILSHNNVN